MGEAMTGRQTTPLDEQHARAREWWKHLPTDERVALWQASEGRDTKPVGEWCVQHKVYDCDERGPCASGRMSSTSTTFVVLDISSLDGQPRRIYGPFDTEREADAFGLAHVGHWTIHPLTPPARETA